MNKTSLYDMPAQYVKGVGEKRAQLLKKLEIENLYDLTHFFPRSYLDFGSPLPISLVKPGETALVKAKIAYPPVKEMIRGKTAVYKTAAEDATGILHITVFNNAYLASSLEQDGEYLFLGKAVSGYRGLEMTNPVVETPRTEPGLRPVYPQTAGLRSKTIESVMKNALALLAKEAPADIIPDNIRREFQLCHEQYALSGIHFPKSEKDAEIAKRRLIFEELFVLQAGMLKIRKAGVKTTDVQIKNDFTEEFFALLPFEPTSAQKRAVFECAEDMKKHEPMNRLVQGDVGCGKTAVAAALMYSAVKNGFQCALMAPTELLAAQHFKTLVSLMPKDFKIALLTGSVAAAKKNEIKEKISREKSISQSALTRLSRRTLPFIRSGLLSRTNSTASESSRETCFPKRAQARTCSLCPQRRFRERCR